MGRPVVGNSSTTTQLAIKLIPDLSRLRMMLEAQGVVSANTSSSTDRVTVFNHSESKFTAFKPVEISPLGLTTQSANATATSESSLCGVRSDFDDLPFMREVVRQMAMSQYDEDRAAAQRESVSKIAARAERQIDEELDQQVADANRQFNQRVLVPLKRLALDPTLFESRTEANCLIVRMRLATDQQLAAATPRPRAPRDSLISLQVHESAFNNIVDRLQLDGRKFTGKELYQHIGQQFNLPQPPQPDETFADAEVTFAERDAVRIRCDAGRLEIALAFAHLKNGARQWRNFEVVAGYTPRQHGLAIELVRDGPISLSGERLNVQSQFVLRGTFNRIFSDDQHFTILSKELGSDPRLAGLQITQFVIDDGWLAAAIGPQRAAPPILATRP